MQISASLVKELREKTGVGLMNCKKALSEANGNLEEAIHYLREKGLASASKKAERSTNEGKVFIKGNNDNTQLILLELNCETDFVASNTYFSELGLSIAQELLTTPAVESIEQIDTLTVNSKPFKTVLSESILKLGENISVKKFTRISSANKIASYTHSNGKIASAVSFSNNVDDQTAKSIAMHIAAANPQYTRPEEVPSNEVDNERNIIRAQVLNEGKPENIVDKIIEGKLNKFYKDICLLEQTYVVDDKKSVKQVLPSGTTIHSFIRYELN